MDKILYLPKEAKRITNSLTLKKNYIINKAQYLYSFKSYVYYGDVILVLQIYYLNSLTAIRNSYAKPYGQSFSLLT